MKKYIRDYALCGETPIPTVGGIPYARAKRADIESAPTDKIPKFDCRDRPLDCPQKRRRYQGTVLRKNPNFVGRGGARGVPRSEPASFGGSELAPPAWRRNRPNPRHPERSAPSLSSLSVGARDPSLRLRLRSRMTPIGVARRSEGSRGGCGVEPVGRRRRGLTASKE